MSPLRAIPPWLKRFFLGALVGGLAGILVALLYPSRENVAYPGGGTGYSETAAPGGGHGGAGFRSVTYMGGIGDDLTLDNSEVIIGKIAVDQALAGDTEGAIQTVEQEKKIFCKDCVRLAVVEALLRQPKLFVPLSTDAASKARAETAQKEGDKKAWAALKIADTFQSSLNKADALRRIGKFQQKTDPAAARETLRKSAELAAGSPWISPVHPVWDWIRSASLWIWTVICGVVAIVLKPTLEEVVGKGIAEAVKKKTV